MAAINPATIALALKGVGLLSSLAGKHYAGKDARKTQQKQKEAQQTANLINAFRSNRFARSEPTPVVHKTGTATNILGKLGQAANIGGDLVGMYQGFQDAESLRQHGEKLRPLQLAEAERKDALARGASKAYQLPIDDTGRRLTSASGGLDVNPWRYAAEKAVMDPTELEGFEKGKMSRLAAKAALDKMRMEAAGGLTPYQKLQTAITVGDQTTKRNDKVADSILKDAALAGTTGIPFDQWMQTIPGEFMMSDYSTKNNFQDRVALAYNAGNKKEADAVNKRFSDLVYGETFKKLKSDGLIRKAGDLKFGINLLHTGYEQSNGAGDVQMTNAFVRLADPGVSVRPAESATVEEAAGYLERLGLIASGEKWLEGDMFTEAVRLKLLNAGRRNYSTNAKTVKDALTNERAVTMHAYGMLFGEKEGSVNFINATSAQALVDKFFATYELPELAPVESLMPTVSKYGALATDAAAAADSLRAAQKILEDQQREKLTGSVR